MDFLGNDTVAGLKNGGEIDGNLDVDGNVVIDGNLDVSGTITADTFIIVDEIKVADTLITMGVGNPADAFNLGILEEHVSGGQKWSGLIRAAADKKQYLIEGATPEPGPSHVGINLLPRGDLAVGDLEATVVTADTVVANTQTNQINNAPINFINSLVTNFHMLSDSANSDNFEINGPLAQNYVELQALGDQKMIVAAPGGLEVKQEVILDGATPVVLSNSGSALDIVIGAATESSWSSFGIISNSLSVDGPEGYETIGKRSRGTLAAKTAILSGDSLMTQHADSYNGTGFVTSCVLDILASENHSVGNAGTAMTISTADDGTAILTQKLALGSNGMEIGDPVNSYLLPYDRGTLNQALISDAGGGVTWQSVSVFDQAVNTTDDVLFNSVSIENGANDILLEGNGGLDIDLQDSKTSYSFSSGFRYNRRSDAAAGAVSRIDFKSRGNLSVPTAINNGDGISSVQHSGHDGTNYKPAARIASNSTQAWSVGNNGAKLIFQTVNDNTAVLTEKLRLDSSGVTCENLLVDNSFTDQSLVFNRSGVQTWDIANNASDDLQFRDALGSATLQILASGDIYARTPLYIGDNAGINYKMPVSNVGVSEGQIMKMAADLQTVEFVDLAPSYAHIGFESNLTNTAFILPIGTYDEAKGVFISREMNNFTLSAGGILTYDGLPDFTCQPIGHYSWEAAGGLREIYAIAWFKNGVIMPGTRQQVSLDNTAIWPVGLSTSTIVTLSTGDYIQLRCTNLISLQNALVLDCTVSVK